MIRDEDGQLTGYVYLDLNTTDYGGFVDAGRNVLRSKLALPAGYTYQWSGEYEFELRAKSGSSSSCPSCSSSSSAALHGLPLRRGSSRADLSHVLCDDRRTDSAMAARLQLQRRRVGRLHRALRHRGRNRRGHGRLSARGPGPSSSRGRVHSPNDIEQAAIEGAVQRLRPKLMTVTAVLASLIPILWETGIGSDVMKPIAAPIVGGMITSTIHVLILVPVFFVMMKERALRRGTLGFHQETGDRVP